MNEDNIEESDDVGGKVELVLDGGRVLSVDKEELSKIMNSMVKITKASISYSMRLNTGNFEGRDHFSSFEVNFEDIWAICPPSSRVDEGSAKIIQSVFANTAMYRIGVAMRNAYKNCMYSALDRANYLKLPQAKAINDELKADNTEKGFDPFNVTGKKVY